MLKVGLTGNIGSGKTIVARIFSQLGVPVFQADTEARKLFDEAGIKSRIRDIFGQNVFSPSDEILRPVLAEIVFSDPKLLLELNKIIHPAVREKYRYWCIDKTTVPYTLYEAAILYESGHYKEMDKVICVTAPEELRISRVMERDGITPEEVKSRMANQWEEEKKVEMADFVIRNDETDSLIQQVIVIHKELIQHSIRQLADNIQH
jgi:dephospho-CoA kinase